LGLQFSDLLWFLLQEASSPNGNHDGLLHEMLPEKVLYCDLPMLDLIDFTAEFMNLDTWCHVELSSLLIMTSVM